MLHNLRKSLEELEERAAKTRKRPDIARVAAVRDEIERVERGEL